MWSGTVAALFDMIDRGQQTSVLTLLLHRHGVRASKHEEHSWDVSLPELARALDGLGLEHHHVVLECPLPGASTRADAILLGEGVDGQRRAVVLELKQWRDARSTGPELVSWSPGTSYLHPCSQVQGYRDYLASYSAALVDRETPSQVDGVVYLHAMKDVRPLAYGVDSAAAVRNEALVRDCPAFGRSGISDLGSWLVQRLGKPPSETFIQEFISLARRPSKALAQTMADILAGERVPWVLLDEQQGIMKELIEPLFAAVAEEAATNSNRRRVVLVTGGAGTGKTALAMKALLVAHATLKLNAVLISTSSAQHHSLLGELQIAGGRNLVPSRKQTLLPLKKTSELRVRAIRDTSFKQADPSRQTPEAWKEYCVNWFDVPEYRAAMAQAPEYDVVICDEAQGLIDGLKPSVDGSPANHWRASWGPQAWHLIARARLSIFLMDQDQGYRQVESNTPDDIAALARREELPFARRTLDGEQFRLAGGAEFAEWLHWMLGLSPQPPTPTALNADQIGRLRDVFAIEDSPGAMRDRLVTLHAADGGRCRLLAGYAWHWASKSNDQLVDSIDGLVIKGRQPPPGLAFRWAAAGADGQRDFNLGTGSCRNARFLFGEGSSPAVVGYPLTVRGRDLDHVGVLWGADLIRREGRWVADTRLVFGSDMPSLRRAAFDEARAGEVDGVAARRLVRAIASAYRILLTRGVCSVRVWIEDLETAAFVRSSWEQFLAAAGNPK